MKQILLTITLIFFLGYTGCASLTVNPTDKQTYFLLPTHGIADETHMLEQNWDAEERQDFYHRPQGTLLLPAAWFFALERPETHYEIASDTYKAPELLSDQEYLARFGFIPDPKSERNPKGLPVGLALDPDFPNPLTGKTMTVVGLSCAACHTGQIHVQKEGKTIALRIDGGQSHVDLDGFREKASLAVGMTIKIPARWQRFSKRILGDNHNEQTDAMLKQGVLKFGERALEILQWTNEKDPHPTGGGPSRTDALGRIGNQVFGVGLNNKENFASISAPVSFPPIWDTPWYSWAQYNASILQPMVRNVGEALGVNAFLNLLNPSIGLFRSSVRLKDLDWMEQALMGQSPFKRTATPEWMTKHLPEQNKYKGLSSPKWPENFLGEIDKEKADRGRKLYDQHCKECHLPAFDSEEIKDPKYWWMDQDLPLLKIKWYDIEKIGTDPTAVVNFRNRTADASKLGLGVATAAKGLEIVTAKVADFWYDQNKTPLAEREMMNGHRDNEVVDRLAYKARPLNGIWATAPFLHNGSVPNLLQLLSPLTERDSCFFVGNRLFDAMRVGFDTSPFEEGFELCTQEKGNHNTGHLYDNPSSKDKGVIGPLLTIQERYELIEYLKTL